MPHTENAATAVTAMTITGGQVIHAFSPPEYQRRAALREKKIADTANLQRFVDFLRDRLEGHALTDVPNDFLDALVDDYLAAKQVAL
jgi:hypothetical protein